MGNFDNKSEADLNGLNENNPEDSPVCSLFGLPSRLGVSWEKKYIDKNQHLLGGESLPGIKLY